MRLKITLLAALIFIVNTLYAQDTTKPFFFPHKTGDMWEYFFFEFDDSWVDTIQNLIILDSVDINGFNYLVETANRINPSETPLLLNDTSKYKIDTVNNYVFDIMGVSDEFKNALVYKLNAQKGEEWMANEDILARVEDKFEDTILGYETMCMRIKYYKIGDINDTLSWLIIYTDEIADGFGLTYRVGAEYIGEIHLIGAVVNGILYGDTTLVSVNNNNKNIPTKIKLNKNYPNPFNPSTTISFEIMSRENILLIIYDLLGNEVFKLIENQELQPGEHKVIWNGLTENGSKAASGIYFYRLITERQSLSRSMILLK